MFNILKNLISKHFYSNKEEAQNKVDVVYGMAKITDGQYQMLTSLVEEVYAEREM